MRGDWVVLAMRRVRNEGVAESGIGMVPPELDGAIVSNDFPSFSFNDLEQCDPAFMGWLVRSTPFVELCKAASEGTTNRVRIKEERFLSQQSDWLQPLEHPHYTVHLLQQSALCTRFPREALTLLDAIIADQPWPPRELEDCLSVIIQSWPEAQHDPRYQRLLEYQRRR